MKHVWKIWAVATIFATFNAVVYTFGSIPWLGIVWGSLAILGAYLAVVHYDLR